jgi:hypothetical protein
MTIEVVVVAVAAVVVVAKFMVGEDEEYNGDKYCRQ